MAIVRYHNPLHELENIRKTTNSFFSTENYRTPAVDIMEDEDNYTFEMALPGFNKDEISIEASRDELTIEAKKVTESIDETDETNEIDDTSDEAETRPRYIRKERRNVAYRRSFSFKNPVNPEDADVTLENGILTIRMAKSEETKPKKLIIEQ